MSDAGAKAAVLRSPGALRELALVLLLRKATACTDTNLFNLMTDGRRVLSVDENPATARKLGELAAVEGLATAQRMDGAVLAAVERWLGDHREEASDFLARLAVEYEAAAGELYPDPEDDAAVRAIQRGMRARAAGAPAAPSN